MGKFDTLLNLGVPDGMNPEDAKYVRMSNASALQMIVVTIPYMILCALNGWWIVFFEVLGVSILLSFTYLFNKKGNYFLANVYFGTTLNVHLMFVTVVLGRESWLQLLIFFTAGGAINLLRRERKVFMVLTFASVLIAYHLALVFEGMFDPLYMLSARQYEVLNNFVVFTIFALVVLNGLTGRIGALATEDNLLAEKKKTEELSLRDGLTGLFNRSAWRKWSERELKRIERTGGTASLAFLDLDDFKQVNDTHGHQTGDQVLSQLAKTLLHQLRGTDLVGRYGGEEFVIFFPDSAGEAAVASLGRILENFRNLPIGEHNLQCSFSAGVSEIRGTDLKPLDEYIRRADKTMYGVKLQGKNRVALYAQSGQPE